ncbi:MAG TPA: DUF3127 domain-containing protein [Bacteroidales bacterium]|nr:DUF3127 domain-containing protein [Bacteroidales bacterium]HQP03247.1 DUF3127 domain-containing protein [Bacteroidales bacterium]
MDITGKITHILPVQTGEGKNGTWKKQLFVIETTDEFPKSVCFTAWGDRVELSKMSVGEQIKVYFDLESREYNNKWFTDAKAWKAESIGAANGTVTPTAYDQPEAIKNLEPEEGDDLPF